MKLTTKQSAEKWAFLSKYSQKELKAALKNLETSNALFGKKGKYWIKDSEHGTHKDGSDTFCAIGAIKRANGPGEDLAFICIGVAMDLLDDIFEDVDEAEIMQEALDYVSNYVEFTTLDDMLKQIRERVDEQIASQKRDALDNARSNAENDIPSFNDNNGTKFSDVNKAWKIAIAQVRKRLL